MQERAKAAFPSRESGFLGRWDLPVHAVVQLTGVYPACVTVSIST